MSACTASAATCMQSMHRQACCSAPGQSHVAGAHGGMSVVAQLLFREASPRMITGEEERLRALRDICSALPRTAQALDEQVRQLSHAQAKRHTARDNR